MEFEKLRPEEVCDLDGQWTLFCPVDCLLEIKGGTPKSCFRAVSPGIIFKGKVYIDRVLATSFNFQSADNQRGCSKNLYPELHNKKRWW